MANQETAVAKVPDEVIMNKIYVIRGQKVMLDRDLAEPYDVEKNVFKQAVRQDPKCFPAGFLFTFTQD